MAKILTKWKLSTPNCNMLVIPLVIMTVKSLISLSNWKRLSLTNLDSWEEHFSYTNPIHCPKGNCAISQFIYLSVMCLSNQCFHWKFMLLECPDVCSSHCTSCQGSFLLLYQKPWRGVEAQGAESPCARCVKHRPSTLKLPLYDDHLFQSLFQLSLFLSEQADLLEQEETSRMSDPRRRWHQQLLLKRNPW